MIIHPKSRAEIARAFYGQHSFIVLFKKFYLSNTRLGLCTYEVDGTLVGDSTLGCTLSLVVLLVDKSIYRNYDRMIGNLLSKARYATSDAERSCAYSPHQRDVRFQR